MRVGEKDIVGPSLRNTQSEHADASQFAAADTTKLHAQGVQQLQPGLDQIACIDREGLGPWASNRPSNLVQPLTGHQSVE